MKLYKLEGNGMKEKNLQPRILHPARFSFRFDGEINLSRQAKVKRSFSRQENKSRKRPTENKPKTIKNMVK